MYLVTYVSPIFSAHAHSTGQAGSGCLSVGGGLAYSGVRDGELLELVVKE